MAAINFDDILNFGDFNQEAKKTEQSIDNLDKSIGQLNDTIIQFMKTQEQAQKEGLKGLQTELQKTDASTKEGQKSIVKYTQAIDKLGNELEENQKTQKDLQQTQKVTGQVVEGLRKQLQKQAQEFEALTKAEGDNDKELIKLARTIKQTQTQITGLEKATKQATKQVEAGQNSYTALNKELNETRRTLKNLDNAFDPVTGELNQTNQEAVELAQRINTLDSSLRAADKTFRQSFRNVGNYAESILEATRELDKQKRSLTAQVAALKQQARATNLSEKEQNQLQKELKETNRQLDEVNTELKQYGVSIEEGSQATQGIQQSLANLGGIIRGGLGLAAIGTAIIAGTKALFDFQQQLEETRKQVSLLTGATGEQLDVLTSKVSAVSSTFRRDFNEVLIAGNAVAKQFGISVEESLDLIGKGFALGADVSGELLDILREYPAQFRTVGISAEGAIAIITNQVQEGIFSDKGIDTIKEAGIRLRELTPATKEALDAIGLSSSEIEESLRTGSQTLFEVIQSVSRQLGTLPPQSREVGQAIADIFGGPGEDAGLEYIKTLATINTNLDEVIENSNDFTRAQIELLRANEKLDKAINDLLGSADNAFASLEANFKSGLAEALIATANGIIDTINFFRELFNQSILFRGVLNTIGVTVDTVFEAIKLNFTSLIEAIKSVGTVFKAVITGDFAEVPGLVKEALIAQKDAFVGFGTGVAQSFIDGYNSTVEPGLLEPLKRLGEDETIKNTIEKSGEFLGRTFAEGFGKGLNDAISAGEIQGFEAVEMAAKDAFANVEGILINSEEAARLSNARKTADEESSRDQRLRIFQEGEESRKEILLQGFDFTVSLINQALQAQQNAFASQFESLRIQEEQRLALVGDNEQEQQKIREEFAKREADLKKQQAQADKRNSLFQIAINTAQGVIAALSQFPGPPATIPFAAIVAAQGAIQAAVVAATPIPQFAEGVIGLQGPGTETSDSIPAFLSKNESVMTGEETRKFRPTLEAIRKKIVSPEVLNSVAVGDHLPDVARQSYISAYNGLSQGLIPSATFEDINASIQANFNANSERMSDKIVDGLRRYRSNVNLTVNASGINVGW